MYCSQCTGNTLIGHDSRCSNRFDPVRMMAELKQPVDLPVTYQIFDREDVLRAHAMGVRLELVEAAHA